MDSPIFPPYEAFYIEAMLFNSTLAVDSWGKVSNHLISGSEDFFLEIQSFLTASSALSKYFWPVRSHQLHIQRADYLKTKFLVDDKSPLKHRGLRNTFEHFDERLDEWLKNYKFGHFMPEYLGTSEYFEKEPHFFRAYLTDRKEFIVLGERYQIEPIVHEVMRIHNCLVDCIENGHRL